MQTRTCDVLIIGAGMAGGCMARQLKLSMPDLKIIVIEKKKEFDYWIGESTVEVWTDYAYRKCGLGPYLHKHHVLKTGLRFFFDSKEKDLPLAKMSENGRAGYVSDICSHQLDRATFDRDLCELNREIGIEVHLGTSVLSGSGSIQVDRKNGHTVNTDIGPITCKWLIDAAGRTSPLAKHLDLVSTDPRHPLGSYWGRFMGIPDMDELGDREWKKRNEFTLRSLSTNHFMYPGYWIWMIPVSDKIYSLGVCFRHDQNPLKMRSATDLFAFLREHRVFRELLPASSVALDFMAFKDCTRKAKQFVSGDRWFITGMSGFVLDALYSTTGRTTAITNQLIEKMIAADRAGNNLLVEKQEKHFNIYLRTYYEAILRSIDTYKEFGSFDNWTGWRTTIQSAYFNKSVPESTEDFKTLHDKVAAHPIDCDCSMEKSLRVLDQDVVGAGLRLLMEMNAYAKTSGHYYDGNEGLYTNAVPRRSLSVKTYEPRDKNKEFLEDLITYEATFRNFLARMAFYEKVTWHEGAFHEFFKRDWHSGQTLAMGLEALRNAKGKAEVDVRVRWSYKGPIDEYGDEISPSRFFTEFCVAPDASKLLKDVA